MRHRPYSRSRSVAKKYPKSNRVNYPCFGKTVYPNESEALKGVVIVWGKDPRVDINDLHAYQCPDGCPGWHIGHKSYYKKFIEKRQEILNAPS